MIELLRDPSIQAQIDRLMTHQFPMLQAEEAFKVILDKKAIKVHLLPQE